MTQVKPENGFHTKPQISQKLLQLDDNSDYELEYNLKFLLIIPPYQSLLLWGRGLRTKGTKKKTFHKSNNGPPFLIVELHNFCDSINQLWSSII